MNYRSILCCAAAIAAVVMFSGRRAVAQGVGDLLIAPTRIVLGGPKRTAEINLINIGDKPATYRISLIHQRMNVDGKLEEIETPAPGEQFADDLIRFTPRQVVLEPHVSQLVRVQLRLPAGLADGEYRSHLLFRAVPVSDVPTDSIAPTAANAPKGVSIRITPIYGVSIPVIVRYGSTSATATIDELKVAIGENHTAVLSGRIGRTGNCSVYGDLVVAYAQKGGAFRPIGRMGGVAVYTPNAVRNFDVPLTLPDGVVLRDGTIRVSFQAPPVDADGLFAEAALAIP